MAKKKRGIHREMDRVKDELLNTAREVVDKTIPTIADGLTKIVSGFASNLGETIRKDLTTQIEKKRSKTKQEEK
jgi:hypothetical protein